MDFGVFSNDRAAFYIQLTLLCACYCGKAQYCYM